jgi:hypothetical protein
MTRKQGPHSAGQSISRDVSLASDAFLRTSWFHTCGMVIDVNDDHLMRALRSTIKSSDGLAALTIAQASGLPCLELIGQLMRRRAGVLAIATEAEQVLPAIYAAHQRITTSGEVWSMWVTSAPQPQRGEVEAFLASLSTVEGCA